jgi:alpha-tubulin suppressor-like RCC1 family protein
MAAKSTVRYVTAAATLLLMLLAALIGARTASAEGVYRAFAWGQDTNRQLGDGTYEALQPAPVGVLGLSSVHSVAAGGAHSLALLANGTVWSWGDNLEGQLGDGTNTSRNEPVQVTAVSGATAVAAGGDHSLALLSNGTVMAWGANESGQLGDGSFQPESTVPVAVKGLSNVIAIAAGYDHSLALLSNGTVMAWGDNTSGELGNGKLATSDVPVAVKGLTGVTSIAAGDEFSLAASKGEVEAWGDNTTGELGNAAEQEELFSDVPVKVDTITTATQVAAGSGHALALLSGGTVVGWGADGSGQVGNGAIAPGVGEPTAVSGLTGVTHISAGGANSAALLTSGSVMTWGADKWGTLGDGATGTASDVPVQVSGLLEVAGISTGGAHMLAFGEPVPVVTATTPTSGASAGGTVVTISGSHFEAITGVTFGGAAATAVTVESPNTIRATAPAGSGTVYVTVASAAGTSAKNAAARFTYFKPPTITSLKAKSGPVTGGTTVVITGTELSGATSVTFGGQSVPFTVNSSKSITLAAPGAAEPGYVYVAVTTTGGTTVNSVKDRYTYTPAVTSVTPNAGPSAGGQRVTVTGAGFALGGTATIFKFGTHRAASVLCESSTSCTMTTTKTTTPGAVDVVATVNKINSAKVRAQDGYTYE